MNKNSRRAATLVLWLAACGASALAAYKTAKPFFPPTPDYRRRGPDDAKVSIVEFSDFECPACRAAEATLRGLLDAHKTDVRFSFKHFPLSIHEWARPAALAAECAGRQGKFWPYHDMLYDHQNDWTNDKADQFFERYATDVKLDVPAWKACLSTASEAVKADMKDGQDAFINATPTFFIDGRRFVGPKQFIDLGVDFVAKELKSKP